MSLRFAVPVVLVLALGGLLPSHALAQSDDGLDKAIARYVGALKRVEMSVFRQRIEPLFELAAQTADELRPMLEAYAAENWQTMPTDDYAKAFEQWALSAKGLDVRPFEGAGVVVRPNLAFFKALAEQKGLSHDIEFFKLAIRESPPESVVPEYVEQRWDYGGCPKYGSLQITRQYLGWKALMIRHPRQYKPAARAYLENVRAYLTRLTEAKICSCTGKPGVLRELDFFIQTLPSDELAPRLSVVRRKLRASSPAPQQFECTNG